VLRANKAIAIDFGDMSSKIEKNTVFSSQMGLFQDLGCCKQEDFWSIFKRIV
jgi:hypothetical protein